jgi:hypothetical protein
MMDDDGGVWHSLLFPLHVVVESAALSTHDFFSTTGGVLSPHARKRSVLGKTSRNKLTWMYAHTLNLNLNAPILHTYTRPAHQITTLHGTLRYVCLIHSCCCLGFRDLVFSAPLFFSPLFLFAALLLPSQCFLSSFFPLFFFLFLPVSLSQVMLCWMRPNFIKTFHGSAHWVVSWRGMIFGKPLCLSYGRMLVSIIYGANWVCAHIVVSKESFFFFV